MDDWIRVEAEATHQTVGDAYYVNLANVAAVHLYTEFAEHGRHPHPAVNVITTGGAVVKIHGEAARDEMRRALERRQLSEGTGDKGGGHRPALHLG
jgi:hypothetical protein